MDKWQCHGYFFSSLGRVISLIAVTWALTACLAPQGAMIPAADPLAATEQVRCAASGGTWQRVCMLGTPACVRGYPDAQKACRSGSDCQGQRCLQVPEARGNTQAQSGRCIANNNPCYGGINLENGLPVPTAQAD